MDMARYPLNLDACESAEMKLALAMLGTPWPSDAELDSLLLEDCETEAMPRRNNDYMLAQDMSPQELLSASRRFSGSDYELQIEALMRLTKACEELRWPVFTNCGGNFPPVWWTQY